MRHPESQNYVPLTIAAMLFVFEAIGLIYVIPKRELHFQDILPGKPLPPLTGICISISRMAVSTPGSIFLLIIAITIAFAFTRRQSDELVALAYASILIFVLSLAGMAFGMYIPTVAITTQLNQ